MFKEALPLIVDEVSKTINQVISTSQYPDDWAESILVLLHKKGAIEDPANYRPINLLDIFFRIVESLLWRRLKPKLEEVLSDIQGGFRRGRGTIEQHFVLQTIIQIVQADQRKLFLAVMDMKKAYDSVDHKTTIYKLASLGADALTCRLLENLISGHRSVLGADSSVEIESGVLQCGILSPGLFNVFIDDIFSKEEHKSMGISLGEFYLAAILFAEDSSLIDFTAPKMQASLNHSARWAKRNGMTWHPDKCYILAIGFTDEERSDLKPFTVNGAEIGFRKSVTALGIDIDNKGVFSRPTLAKARRKLESLRGVANGTLGFQTRVGSLVWQTMIMPTFTYGSELGIKYTLEMRTLQRRCARAVICAPINTSSAAMFEFLGWTPVDLEIEREILLFAMRLNKQKSPIIKEAIRLTREMKLPWLQTIIAICKKHGLDQEKVIKGQADVEEVRAVFTKHTLGKWKKGKESVKDLLPYPELLNKNLSGDGNSGKGSSILRGGLGLHSRAAFWFRYGSTAHFLRHPSMQHMVRPCPLCWSPGNACFESPEHLIFECNFSRVQARKERVMLAQEYIRDVTATTEYDTSTPAGRKQAILYITGPMQLRPKNSAKYEAERESDDAMFTELQDAIWELHQVRNRWASSMPESAKSELDLPEVERTSKKRVSKCRAGLHLELIQGFYECGTIWDLTKWRDKVIELEMPLNMSQLLDIEVLISTVWLNKWKLHGDEMVCPDGTRSDIWHKRIKRSPALHRRAIFMAHPFLKVVRDPRLDAQREPNMASISSIPKSGGWGRIAERIILCKELGLIEPEWIWDYGSAKPGRKDKRHAGRDTSYPDIWSVHHPENQ
jgi:hypothetical protein